MSLSNSQIGLRKLWGYIFRNDSWLVIASELGLDPALAGRDLHSRCDSSDNDSEIHPCCLVFVTGDRTGSICFYSKIFLDSLMPHTFYKATNEVFFTDPSITLNVHDPLECPNIIFMEPEKLILDYDNRLCSPFLFWNDASGTLRSPAPQDIVGIGGQAVSLNNVSVICGIVLNPSSKDHGPRKVQQVFCVKGLRGKHVRPINQMGHVYNGDKCAGWKWAGRKESRPLSLIIEEI